MSDQTMSDADFDAVVRKAFSRAETEFRSDGFVASVETRLSENALADRRRVALLGGAGAAGALISVAQLEGLIAWLDAGRSFFPSHIAAAGPETVAAALVAAPLVMIAWLHDRGA